MSRERNTYFFPTAIRRMMKQFGATVVSQGSIESMIELLERRTREITAYAVKLASHAGRKRVNKEDIRLAIDVLKEGQPTD